MTKRIVLLQALASTSADIARLVRPLDRAAADWKPDLIAWSPRDIVSHLTLVERAYLARLKRIITEDEPTVPYIHPDEAAHDRQTPLAELSEAFRLAREDTLATLQALGPGGWQRAAIHETRGRVTLRFLVQDLVGHDIEHTNQLVEVIQLWRLSRKQEAAPVSD
jgi:hypothetical protein